MHRIGVCSWSLRPRSPHELMARVRETGVSFVQLHLDPLRLEPGWVEERTTAALAAGGARIVSGMMSMRGEDYSTLETIRRTGGVRPDEHWEDNLSAAHANAALARRLGLDLVSFHAGFLPHESSDPEREVMLDRLRAIADAFAAADVRVALETGQESADTLLGVLEELGHESVGVNFDPANMLLYDMGDPVDSLRKLVPWVRQIHVKDAVRAKAPGEWGEEVLAGTGEVNWESFFGVLRESKLDVDLMIEREAGDDRSGDVSTAREMVEGMLV
ncbi:MAG: sugar phosphate isomerase/epimerase family protein [Planctomycetota bacterium]